MTQELQTKLNTAIAEWCGWTHKDCTWTSPGGSRYADRVKRLTSDSPLELIPLDQILPNYFSSLDACHEVIVRMDDRQKLNVFNKLDEFDEESFSYEADAPTMASAIAYALGLWDGKE